MENMSIWFFFCSFVQHDPRKSKSFETPSKIYQELLEVKFSLEIYQQPEVQASLQRAKQDVETNRVKTVQTVDEAIEWLNQ